MDEALLCRVRSHLASVRVPSNYDKVYKDECMYSFATPESEHGLFVNMANWHGVGARFLDIDNAKTGNVLYYNEQHRRIPLSKQEQTAREVAPTKMAIGGDHGFQVGQKGYNIAEEQCLVLMPERTTIPLPCPELPELILNAIAAIQVCLRKRWSASCRLAACHTAHACLYNAGPRRSPQAAAGGRMGGAAHPEQVRSNTRATPPRPQDLTAAKRLDLRLHRSYREPVAQPFNRKDRLWKEAL